MDDRSTFHRLIFISHVTSMVMCLHSLTFPYKPFFICLIDFILYDELPIQFQLQLQLHSGQGQGQRSPILSHFG